MACPQNKSMGGYYQFPQGIPYITPSQSWNNNYLNSGYSTSPTFAPGALSNPSMWNNSMQIPVMQNMPAQMANMNIMPSSQQMQNSVNIQSPVTTQQESPGTQEGPPTLEDESYFPAFLRNFIGRYVRLEFMLGTSTYVDKAGILVEVGVNYVVLQLVGTVDLVLCDLYSIKFVNVIMRPITF